MDSIDTIRVGLEVEYDSRVEMVVSELYERGLVYDRQVHRYHCDCDGCDFDSHYAWRAQRDSSCGGELISGILTLDNLTTATDALSLCAREAGARMSHRCGLHVHVSKKSDTPYLALAGVGFLGIESYISDVIAPGAWTTKRRNNVTLVERAREASSDRGTREPVGDDNTAILYALQDRVQRAVSFDRHTDFNISDSHQTVEIRAFNTSRTSWRMELAALTSAYIVADATWLANTTVENRGSILLDYIDGRRRSRPSMAITRVDLLERMAEFSPRLMELAQRQEEFLASGRGRDILSEAF